MVIPAEAQSDDEVFAAVFDAEPYFEAAEDQQLMELFKADFSGLPAAELAYARRDEPALARLFAHLERTAGSVPGFSCQVDALAAQEWIVEHRPTLAARIERRPDVDAAIARRLARFDNQGDFDQMGRG